MQLPSVILVPLLLSVPVLPLLSVPVLPLLSVPVLPLLSVPVLLLLLSVPVLRTGVLQSLAKTNRDC